MHLICFLLLIDSANENQIGKVPGFLEIDLILIHSKSSHIMNSLDGYNFVFVNSFDVLRFATSVVTSLMKKIMCKTDKSLNNDVPVSYIILLL